MCWYNHLPDKNRDASVNKRIFNSGLTPQGSASLKKKKKIISLYRRVREIPRTVAEPKARKHT